MTLSKERHIDELILLEKEIIGAKKELFGFTQLIEPVREILSKLTSSDKLRLLMLWRICSGKIFPLKEGESVLELPVVLNYLDLYLKKTQLGKNKLKEKIRSSAMKLGSIFHTPSDITNATNSTPLAEVVEQLGRKTLTEVDFPAGTNRYENCSFQRIFVYMIGGITVSEIKEIEEIKINNTEIMIGSDAIINGDDFILNLSEIQQKLFK